MKLHELKCQRIELSDYQDPGATSEVFVSGTEAQALATVTEEWPDQDYKILPLLRPELFERFKEGWVHPTFNEVRELLAIGGALQEPPKPRITGAEASKLTGSDSRTVRRWMANPVETNGAAPIPYACWRLLLTEFGLV